MDDARSAWLPVFAIAGRMAAPTSTGTCDDRPSWAGPAMYETQAAIDDYVSSGRYSRDVAAVVGQARIWLERQPSIVVHADEAALSNWPA